MYRKELMQLGLAEKEALVYLTLLRIGASPASTLARTTNIKRTSIYDILNSLLEKNLITTFRQGRFTYFVIDDVNKLYLQEKQKLETAKSLVEKFKNHEGLQSSIQIHYYKGTEGFREIHEDILRADPEEILTWINLDFYYKGLDLKADEQWTEKRVARKIPARMIVVDTPFARKFKEHDNKFLRKMRLISPDAFTTNCTVFGQHIAFFDSSEEIIAVRIHNPRLAQMMRQIFEMNWQGLS